MACAIPKLVLRFSQSGASAANLGVGLLILCQRIVQFLLGDQPRTLLRSLLEPRVSRVVSLVRRLRPFDFTLRAANRVFTAPDVRSGAFDLSIQFGNLQNGQHLPRLDLVPHIHKDLLDVSGNLGVNIDLLGMGGIHR